MSENCMANCMAKQFYLQLRNKIFHYRVELPRVNNKRIIKNAKNIRRTSNN